MDPKINELYTDFRKGKIDRRIFLKKLAMLAGGTAAAYSLLPLLEGNTAMAVSPTRKQAELQSGMIKYPGATGEVMAFMARPQGDDKLPAVIVIHENKGLVSHIKDVTKRMAAEGFLALAPDANSPLGGTPEDDPDKGRNMMRELDREKTVEDFLAAVKYLDTHPLTSGKVGCTGFCWGGAMTNQLAVKAPELDAAVPYYGSQPDSKDVPKIKAAVMAHYAGNDERINAGIEEFEQAMKKAGIEYTIYMYEGASHAFNNDSNPERYHEEAAKLAWERTIKFFREKLG
ncbi:MAG: dienelactone hydrolase family protein [Bacteroidales bacterium]|jgi:carboxymethylenebutenolidase|nr:dienelactone hydrolase family protein [Bacteroidales bacterium]